MWISAGEILKRKSDIFRIGTMEVKRFLAGDIGTFYLTKIIFEEESDHKSELVNFIVMFFRPTMTM